MFVGIVVGVVMVIGIVRLNGANNLWKKLTTELNMLSDTPLCDAAWKAEPAVAHTPKRAESTAKSVAYLT